MATPLSARTRLAVVVGVLASLLIGAAALLSTTASVGAATSTLDPIADAHVRSDQPGENFGSATGLRVDGSPDANAYLRFDVGVPAGDTVTSAALRVFATKDSTSGFTVHRVTDNGWDEATITYAAAPAIGERVSASGRYKADEYVTVDVTPLVAGSGLVSIAIERSSTTSGTYNSREAASNRPQLIVESVPSAGPPPPPAEPPPPPAEPPPPPAEPPPPPAEPPPPPAEPPPPPPPATAQTVVYAVGDGADGKANARALATYVQAQNPDRFVYLGDVYETGTAAEFASNYEPLYGTMAAKTDPVIGNHESGNRETGYYPYWMGKRGWTEEQATHRSYVDTASGWQVIAYSSEQESLAAEAAWVAGEVAKHAGTCRIVIAHKGRHVVADTAHEDNVEQEPVWSAIAGNTAINLVGHNHIYGRLAPIDGTNVIVSGAGGHGTRDLGSQHHEVVASATHVPTATRLVLRAGAADFSQVDKDGNVHDSGTIPCTPAP